MALDAFLKITDVSGESKDKAHEDEIDVLGWNWGGRACIDCNRRAISTQQSAFSPEASSTWGQSAHESNQGLNAEC